ncbi:MAG: winged-helix single-stranded DNA-binding protein Sul7s [Thermoprotei archaeon]
MTDTTVKDQVEDYLRKREWATLTHLLRAINAPALEINAALIELMKEGKVKRRGKYFFYSRNT